MFIPRVSLPSLIAGTAFGVLLAGGAAYATVQITGLDVVDGSLTGVDLADGSIRSADLQDGSVTTRDIRDDTIETDDLGPNSVTGDHVADFSLSNQDVGVLYAQVGADGSVGANSGGVKAYRMDKGVYSVDFDRNTRSCVAMATIGKAGIFYGPAEAGFATTRDEPDETVVGVETLDATRARRDSAFRVILVC